MIEIAKAIRIIDRQTGLLASEKVPLSDAVGRVLRENIIADTDLPPFDRSQMDGYAMIAADTNDAPVKLNLVGESAAGRGWHKTLKRGQAVRIMTGAPVPKGADSVQKIELTRESANGSVDILEPTEKGRFIVRRGAEIKKGKAVFKAGEIITDGMIASLASFGYAKIKVGKQPRVAILGTGSEIVDINRKPGRDQIRNSNSVMLDVLCRKFGGPTTVLPIAKDEISNLKLEIRNAVKSDILIITGGVSVGKYDHTKAALIELGAEIFFDKVRLKPGKPAVFARLGSTLIFGLPGNPVSAAVTFQLFVRKAILKMQAATLSDAKSGIAVLAADAKGAKGRDTYLPSRLETDSGGRLMATPLKWLGSSDFVAFSRANALVFVPARRAAEAGLDRIFFVSLTMAEPKAIAHEAIHETVEGILRGVPLGPLLDVPAGEGALALRLQRLGFNVACCDLYPEIFKLDSVEIRSGNLDSRLPYEDASFVVVVCVEGLEHIQNPTNAVAEFSRVLRPGGRIVVSVPNIMNIEERLKWLIHGYTSHFKPLSREKIEEARREYPGMEEIALHVNPIGYSELRFLLEKYGFELESTHVDKPKKNSWAFWPIVAPIRLISKLSSSAKRKARWTDELNSNQVLLGGNTLIFSARKL